MLKWMAHRIEGLKKKVGQPALYRIMDTGVSSLNEDMVVDGISCLSLSLKLKQIVPLLVPVTVSLSNSRA